MAEPSPLRIAMVIQSYLPRLGGAENQLAAVCRHLRQSNIEPVIITRRYADMSSFEMIDQTPVYRTPAPQPKFLAAFCYIFFGLRIIKKIQPDVIHAHELLSPCDLAIQAKKKWQIPVMVKVLRGGKLGDLDKLNHRWTGKARIGRMKKYIDRFLAISQEIMGELTREGIEVDRCRFLPNGVDLEVFKVMPAKEKGSLRKQLDLPQGLLVIYSGRLAPEKGLPTLLEAWNEFAKSHPNATLLILGSGAMEAELRSMASEHVQFAGYVADPAPYLMAGDIFILPSETEGLSNAMLEAMACGLAVVATRVGAAVDVITDHENGLLIEPGDIAGIVSALDFLDENQEKRAYFGKKAAQKVSREFSLDSTVTQLVDLYHELAGGII